MDTILTKKRDLLKYQNGGVPDRRKKKWKKFAKMSPEEKKERIKYLWDRVRNYVNQMRFVK